MKKYLFHFSKLFLVFNILFLTLNKAQVTIYQDNFEAVPAGQIGTWQQGYFGTLAVYPYNYFYVQNSGCSNVIAGTKSMQVVGVTSPTTALCGYQNIPPNNTNFKSLIYHQIDAAGYANITLSYKWRCYGEISGTTNYDYGQLMYSLDGSTGWTVITDYIKNGNANTVTVSNLSLPATIENKTFYIGWAFRADESTTNYPGLTVDDIVIQGTPIVTCNPVTASASKYVICAGESVTLSAASATTGYTYTWYTNWDNNTHSGTLVGTGAAVIVNPTSSTLYGIVATKTGCPTGTNAAYDLISIAVTPPPTLVVLDPIDAVTCSNELREIKVVSGGNIPTEALVENWDPIKNPWTTNANVGSGGNANNALWYLYASGGIASPDSSNFAMVNSDETGPYVIESNLVSSPISLLDYNTPINLTFKHYYSTYNSPPLYYSTATVEVSEDGMTWSILKTYTASDVGGPTNFAAESINLNGYSGKPFLLLRFHYVGRYDDVWAIDDIKITGSAKPTTITWSPTAGLFTNTSGTSYTGGHASTLYASPTNTTTYTVSAKTAVGCPASTTVTVERGDKNWQGTTVDWATAANWNENKVPTANHCVKIPLTAIKPTISIGTNAFAKNLTIGSGGKLQIAGNLTVTDFIKNENATPDDVVIASDGNLKQVTDSPLPANSGSVTAKRNIKFRGDDRLEYNYLISPVVGQSLKTIYPGVPTTSTYPYVLYHNEAINSFGNSTGAYIAGRGLAVKEPTKAHIPAANLDAVFKGPLANGIIDFPLAFTNNVTYGYNLVGNPYASNIDLQTLYTLNGGSLTNPSQVGKITSTFYFWDNSANDQYTQQGNGYNGRAYAVFNAYSGTGNEAGYLLPSAPIMGSRKPNKIAKVGQGFMVRATAAGNSLRFNNTIRVTDNAGAGFFSKSADSTINRYWLQLITPTNLVNTIAIVHFEGGAETYGMDDSALNVSSSDMFYSISDQHKVQIEGRPAFVNTDRIFLGSAYFASGNYTIALGQKEGIFANGQNIYLKDQQTGIVTNLSTGPYIFAASAGESTGRFEIIYKPETVLETGNVAKDELIIYRDGSSFVVKAQRDKITALEVYDGVGRLILSMTPNDVKVTVPADQMVNGVYVLKINQGGKITTKKVIR